MTLCRFSIENRIRNDPNAKGPLNKSSAVIIYLKRGFPRDNLATVVFCTAECLFHVEQRGLQHIGYKSLRQIMTWESPLTVLLLYAWLQRRIQHYHAMPVFYQPTCPNLFMCSCYGDTSPFFLRGMLTILTSVLHKVSALLSSMMLCSDLQILTTGATDYRTSRSSIGLDVVVWSQSPLVWIM